jgi:UDP-glucose 6-dehydrogenase
MVTTIGFVGLNHPFLRWNRNPRQNEKDLTFIVVKTKTESEKGILLSDNNCSAFITNDAKELQKCKIIFVSIEEDFKQAEENRCMEQWINHVQDTALVIDSTVSVSTCERIQKWINKRIPNRNVEIYYWPQYIERTPTHDFDFPSPLVLGGPKVYPWNKELLHFLKRHIRDPILMTTRTDAELIYLFKSSFTEMKRSFMSEASLFASQVGGDIDTVLKGMQLDNRDQLMTHELEESQLKLGKVFRITAVQQIWLRDSVERWISDQSFPHIAVWGMNPMATRLIDEWVEKGCIIHLHDPNKMPPHRFPKTLQINSRKKQLYICSTESEAVRGADVLVILQQDPIYLRANLYQIGKLMRHKRVVDYCNLYPAIEMKQLDYQYARLGNR